MKPSSDSSVAQILAKRFLRNGVICVATAVFCSDWTMTALATVEKCLVAMIYRMVSRSAS